MVKNGCSQSGQGALKSQEWTEWTDFLNAGANSGKLKVISLIFEWSWLKMGIAIYLVHETQKSALLKNECMNWADFLHAGCDAIIFRLDQHCILYLWLLNASLQQMYLLDPQQ